MEGTKTGWFSKIKEGEREGCWTLLPHGFTLSQSDQHEWVNQWVYYYSFRPRLEQHVGLKKSACLKEGLDSTRRSKTHRWRGRNELPTIKTVRSRWLQSKDLCNNRGSVYCNSSWHWAQSAFLRLCCVTAAGNKAFMNTWFLKAKQTSRITPLIPFRRCCFLSVFLSKPLHALNGEGSKCGEEERGEWRDGLLKKERQYEWWSWDWGEWKWVGGQSMM